MTQKTPNFSVVMSTLVIALSLLIASQCVFPFQNEYSRYIAENSIYVMLMFFALGWIAFFMKKPYLILYFWMGTAGLCHFLKDGSSPFYYTEAHQAAPKWSIAQFSLKGKADQQKFIKLLPTLTTDIVSVQSLKDSIFDADLSTEMKAHYPFSKKIQYLDHSDNQYRSSFVFSKFRLNNVDSFHCGNIPYLSGAFKLKNFRQPIQFVNLYIPHQIKTAPAKILKRLDDIATNWDLDIAENKPFMAFGDIPGNAWSPEIRAFRSQFTLHDSRLDMDLKSYNKHIFYSSHVNCIQFKSLENGLGVMGQYQINNFVHKSALQNEYFNSKALTSR